MSRNVKCSFYMKCAMFVIVLLLCFLVTPRKSWAAEEENKVVGRVDLKKDTVYNYDLDGNGTNEKLYYESNFTEDTYTSELKIYINDNLCFSREEENCFYFSLVLCDLDESDNYLDIYLFGITDSDGVRYSSFSRYNNGYFTENKTFNPRETFDIYRYSLAGINGDGTFTIIADTPVYSEAIGCYVVYLPYQIKDNKFSSVPTSFYSFHKDSKSYSYKAKKNFTVYKKIGSKIVAFNVKKGNKVHFDMLYVTKSGKAYVRAISSTGKKGWIRADLSELFYERPLWG